VNSEGLNALWKNTPAGGTLTIPPGWHTIDATLDWRDKAVKIEAYGAVLYAKTPFAGDVLRLGGTLGKRVKNLVANDLTIQGDGTYTTGVGLRLTNASNCRFTGLEINTLDKGLVLQSLDGADYAYTYYTCFDRCRFNYNHIGVSTSGKEVNCNRFVCCDWSGTRDGEIFVLVGEGAGHWDFLGGTMQTTAEATFFDILGGAVLVDHLYFEGRLDVLPQIHVGRTSSAVFRAMRKEQWQFIAWEDQGYRTRLEFD
jgi:hypothetical protein